MFGEPCPHCKKKLSINQRKGLLNHIAIYCRYCAKPIKIKDTHQLLNSVAIGVICGGSLGILTDLKIEYLAMVSALISVFFQRYLDIFYSLEIASESDLL